MNMKNPALAHLFTELDEQNHNVVGHLPQGRDVARFADEMLGFLFGFNSQSAGSASNRYAELMDQLRLLLNPLDVNSATVIEDFSVLLPVIHSALLDDARAALAFDPAATSLTEVVATYPGFRAIAIYRLANLLAYMGAPLLPRMLTEYAHSKTGIDIHPTAEIGRSFVIDHGTGVVIGATARIGDHVTLYHGVTLGALQVKKSDADVKRHPTVEDHVTIYANATVLGGKTVIGRHSVIGGNVWVTRSVPSSSRIYFKGGATVNSPKTSVQNQPAIQANKSNPLTNLLGLCQEAIASLITQSKRLLLLDESI